MEIPKINKEIFKKYNIKLAYIFGSRAKGKSGRQSDVDIAVLFQETPRDPLALKEITTLSVELSKFFPAKLDVVSLNDASILLQHEVISSGKPLYLKNERERINYEVSVIKQYILEQPIRKLYNDSLEKRIRRGA